MTSTAASSAALPGSRWRSVEEFLDNVFSVIAGAASLWLAYLVLRQGFILGWRQVLFDLIFWLLLAYIALPRLHRILTGIYVPNYFIGRTRTSDGLLGDPVNLALRGSEEQIHTALLDAGWTRADDLTFRSSWRLVASTILRRSYDDAPVSPLMLFGRNQDFAYQQEVLGNPARRHHVRFWRCPDGWLLPGGHRSDWLAAGTYDRAVGFSLFTLQITHKIDENTDAERDHVVHTLTTADREIAVVVLQDFAAGYHSRNGGGDEIATDGDLPVIDLHQVTVSQQGKDEVEKPVPMPRRDGVRTGAPDKVVRRPAPTTFGGLVVLFRALLPLLTVTGAAAGWPRLDDVVGVIEGTHHVPSVAGSVLQAWAVPFAAALYLLVEAALGLLVFFGSNLARILVMVSSTATILIAAVDHFLGGSAINLGTNLVSLALDILILTALSSTRADAYANRPRGRKASRLAVRV
jgi:LssY-like putative type I secretion system component LssY